MAPSHTKKKLGLKHGSDKTTSIATKRISVTCTSTFDD
jgi:hypothetical protein